MLDTSLEDFFDIVNQDENSEIHMRHDRRTGLKAIIAINSLKKGPTLGGCRCVPYSSTFKAIEDALLLARAMTLKSAIAGVPFGGGKAVLVNNGQITDRKAYFTEYGKFVESLGGKYITAVDSGTDLNDMDTVLAQTKYVSSTSQMDSSPAPYTSLGVFHGLKAAIKHKLNTESFSGLRIAVQGIGAVGLPLCKLLADDGAKLVIADVNPANIKEAERILGNSLLDVVKTDEIFAVDADILSPNALGAVLNDETISQIKAPIIGGAANNQLANEKHGDMLMKKDILFSPDFVINAGGLIYAANKYMGVETTVIEKHIKNIFNTMSTIFNDPSMGELQPQIIAKNIALQKLAD